MEAKTKTLQEILSEVQKKIDVPKDHVNEFGGYKYRNAEDILEAAKKLLPDGVTVHCRDEVVYFGGVNDARFYIKATASITDGKMTIEVPAFAREELTKKGMDAAQVTGATSSYARKYALNGLFAIDDVKDADTMDNRQVAKKPTASAPTRPAPTTSSVQNYGSCPEHGDPVNRYGGHKMPNGTWCNLFADANKKPAATAPVVNNDPNTEIN